MKLFVNGNKVAENPNRMQLWDALDSLLAESSSLRTPSPSVRLQRNNQNWICAEWSSGAGIQLKSKQPRTGEIQEDDIPFISLRQTKAIFRSFNQGSDGWKEMTTWRPEGHFSWKQLVKWLVWGGRMGYPIFMILFLAAWWLNALPEPAGPFDTPSLSAVVVTGVFLAVGGAMCLFELPTVAYWNELTGPMQRDARLFLFGIFFVILGFGGVAHAAFSSGVQSEASVQNAESTNGISEPKLIGSLDSLNSQIQYPNQALEECLKGRLIVTMTVKPDGSVNKVEVSNMRGDSARYISYRQAVRNQLDEEALRVARQARFQWPEDWSDDSIRGYRTSLPITFQPPEGKCD
jgi:TonB family protein